MNSQVVMIEGRWYLVVYSQPGLTGRVVKLGAR